MIRSDIVKVVADSFGVTLTDQAVHKVCTDTEKRIKWLLEDVKDVLSVTKRSKLTSADLNALLRVNRVDSLYGYESGEKVFYKSIGPTHSHSDDALYYEDDQIVELSEFLEQPLPPSVALCLCVSLSFWHQQHAQDGTGSDPLARCARTVLPHSLELAAATFHLGDSGGSLVFELVRYRSADSAAVDRRSALSS